MAAREAAALDGLAEKLLGKRQKRRDEEEDGGPPACHEEVNVTVGLRSEIGILATIWNYNCLWSCSSL